MDIALGKLEALRTSPDQVIKAYSYSVDSLAGASEAYSAVCAAHGGKPADAVFLCAGAAYPCFWIEASEETVRNSMDMTYWVAAWTARVVTERMARGHHPGKIVFVSSVIAYFGLVGYSTYSPGKFAIRGLAESLRQELLLYDIDVHLYLPATFQSPGYETENKTKPAITLKIEEADPVATAEECAVGLLKGVERGDFHITHTFNAEAFRTNSRGASPWNGFGRDLLYGLIGFIGLPLWRQGVDKMVQKHKKEHDEYLGSRGFFNSAEL